jgi:hypothetical protein
VWRDEPRATGAECVQCGWAVSPLHRFCPWCRAAIGRAGAMSPVPLPDAPGFRRDAACDWACGGGVQYPMPWCPWCGRDQDWDAEGFEGVCTHCSLGVDDWMRVCPWCGRDPSGGELIRPALERVDQLLQASGIPPWSWRVLLRPGVSGVDPAFPRIVEINRAWVVGKRPADVPWTLLVGLIAHELGHSFLYHHLDWARSEPFRQAFGDVDLPYRVPDDVPVEFHHHRVPANPVHHLTTYARYHPQEDFAETFRYYVTRAAGLEALAAELDRRRKAPAVLRRFLVLDAYVRSLRPGAVTDTGAAGYPRSGGSASPGPSG